MQFWQHDIIVVVLSCWIVFSYLYILNHSGEEGEVCLPHFKHAKHGCDKKMPSCRGVESGVCINSGNLFWCITSSMFFSYYLKHENLWPSFSNMSLFTICRFRMHYNGQPLIATLKLEPYSRLFIQENHHLHILGQTSSLLLFKKLWMHMGEFLLYYLVEIIELNGRFSLLSINIICMGMHNFGHIIENLVAHRWYWFRK